MRTPHVNELACLGPRTLNAPDETHRARTTVRSAPYPLGSMSFAQAGAGTSRNVASSRLPSYPSQLQMGSLHSEGGCRECALSFDLFQPFGGTLAMSPSAATATASTTDVGIRAGVRMLYFY